MRNPIDVLVGWFDPVAGVRRAQARKLMARAYEAASGNDGWRPRRAGASANADHVADAPKIRAKARSLVQNVPTVARGLNVLVSSTIGTGITPVSLAASKRRKAQLESLWAAWAPVADADGVLDVYGIQAAAYRAMEQDGEVLIRRRMRRPEDRLPVPLQLQVLEIDYLDSSKQGTTQGNGRIVNGIEYDALGKVRAYWLFDRHPGDPLTGGLGAGSTSRAIPASEIIHLFAPTRPGQGRGMSRLAPIIPLVRDMMLYADAELHRKNLETRLGIVTSGDIDAVGDANVALSDPGSLGELPSGTILNLPPGLNITQLDPKAQPGFVEYMKFNDHRVAAGMGVPYESLTGDMREVNFSSARIRRIEFRAEVEQMQWLVLVPMLCTPIWRWFVDAAELGGAIDRAEYAVDWSTPRWEYVNPEQDVNAELKAISGGLLTPSEALRRRGYKPQQVFEELGRDLAAMKAAGATDLMAFFKPNGTLPESPPPTD